MRSAPAAPDYWSISWKTARFVESHVRSSSRILRINSIELQFCRISWYVCLDQSLRIDLRDDSIRQSLLLLRILFEKFIHIVTASHFRVELRLSPVMMVLNAPFTFVLLKLQRKIFVAFAAGALAGSLRIFAENCDLSGFDVLAPSDVISNRIGFIASLSNELLIENAVVACREFPA